MTNVSFQPYTKPMIKPEKNVDDHCTKDPILSPIPSWIFAISLKNGNKVKESTQENKVIFNTKIIFFCT